MHAARIFLLGLTLALTGLCHAAPATQPVPVVSARLHFVSASREIGDLVLARADGTALPIQVPTAYIAGPFDYTGPAMATLLRRVSASSAPVATKLSFQLPAAGGDFLVLCDSADGQNGRTLVVDYSPGQFPRGSYSLLCLDSRRLGVQLADTRTVVEPGRRYLVNPGLLHDDYVDLVVYGIDEKGRNRALSSGRLKHTQDSRHVLFLFGVPGSPRVKVRVVSDLAEKSDAPPALAKL